MTVEHLTHTLRGKLQAVTLQDMGNFFALYLAFGLALAGSVISFHHGRPECYFAGAIAIQFATAWAWKPPFEPWDI